MFSLLSNRADVQMSSRPNVLTFVLKHRFDDQFACNVILSVGIYTSSFYLNAIRIHAACDTFKIETGLWWPGYMQIIILP